MELERGTIHAMIWAPPGEFLVGTPSALAVDLGCAYTLQVDDSGAGLLRTRMGWVGFRLNGRAAVIPAGAVGEKRAGIGAGAACFEDAAAEVRVAIRGLVLSEARQWEGRWKEWSEASRGCWMLGGMSWDTTILLCGESGRRLSFPRAEAGVNNCFLQASLILQDVRQKETT